MNHLAQLGLTTDATVADVRKAYRKLSLRWHPDKPSGDASKFQKVKEAYEFLNDPQNFAALRSSRAAPPPDASRDTQTRRKRHLAEILKQKEESALRRRRDLFQAKQEFKSTFGASKEQAKAHRYPSNYVPSSPSSSSSSDTEHHLEELRRNVKKVVEVKRVHKLGHLFTSEDEG